MPFLIALPLMAFLLTWVGVPRFSQLLEAGGAVRKNYAGDLIPVAAGLAILASLMITYFLAGILLPEFRIELLTVLAVVLTISLLGLVDDLLGTRDTTGLKGHISMLLKGKLTTGGLKALGGGGLALGFSFLFSGTWTDIIVNTGVVALFTNAINLTDLRPGRAAKSFLILGIFFVPGALMNSSVALLVLLPGLASVLAFLPFDLKAKVMMGDTGSNVLGILLGMVSVFTLSLPWRMGILALLLLLHVYTEKYSLTETIKGNKVLRIIDEWGTHR